MTGRGNSNGKTPDNHIPDGGWGWVVVFSSFMIHLIMDGITYSMADTYLEPMLEASNGSRTSISAIFSNLPAVTLVTGPVASVFTTMYGCRIVTIVGACLAATGFFLSRWWNNVVYYYITIGAMGGIGFGLIYAPAIIAVEAYFKKRKSLALGIAISASGFGTLLFPPLMHWMIESLFQNDFKPALLVKAGIISTCIIWGALMVPLPHERSEQRREQKRIRKYAKQQTAANVDTRNALNTEEQQQQNPLLVDQQQSDSVAVSVSDNVDKYEQPNVSETRPVPQLSSVQSDSDDNDEENEHVQPRTSSVVQKDVSDQDNLKNVHLSKENTNEYHKRIIAPHETRNKSDSVANAGDKKVKRFFSELKHEVGIKFLANSAFLLFTISNFMTSLGFNVPYNFAHDLAKDAEVQEHHRQYVVMSIGLSNALGRIIIGYLGDLKINRLYLYSIALLLAGIATMLAPYCNSSIFSHILYASGFGFFSGGYVGLTLVLIGDIVGEENQASALGVILLFQGAAVFIGTPLTGYMRDKLSNHSRPFLWPYFTFGGFIVLSGIILFGLPALKRRQQNSRKLAKTEEDAVVVSQNDENTTSHKQ